MKSDLNIVENILNIIKETVFDTDSEIFTKVSFQAKVCNRYICIFKITYLIYLRK